MGKYAVFLEGNPLLRENTMALPEVVTQTKVSCLKV